MHNFFIYDNHGVFRNDIKFEKEGDGISKTGSVSNQTNEII